MPLTGPRLNVGILVLAGGKDEPVLWAFPEPFFERVEVGEDVVKKVVVYPNVGHAFTASMEDVTNFVSERGCRLMSCNDHRNGL